MARVRVRRSVVWVVIGLAVLGYALLQPEFALASSLDRGVAVYGTTHLNDCLASTGSSVREEAQARHSSHSWGAALCLAPDPLNASRLSVLGADRCSDGLHAPSILALQRHLRI